MLLYGNDAVKFTAEYLFQNVSGMSWLGWMQCFPMVLKVGRGEWEILLWENFFIKLWAPKEDFDHLNLFQKLKTTSVNIENINSHKSTLAWHLCKN